jgi:predicted SAM-dependent methyltransferase
VGCGEHPREGFVGCDIRKTKGVESACKARNLSDKCLDVEEIYSHHTLEHLTMFEFELALKDWRRALAPAGQLTIVVPSLDFHCHQWLRANWNETSWSQPDSDARHAFAGFYGWQRKTDAPPGVNRAEEPDTRYWDVHKSGFSAASLEFFLKRAGFSNIRCNIIDGLHLVAPAEKAKQTPSGHH